MYLKVLYITLILLASSSLLKDLLRSFFLEGTNMKDGSTIWKFKINILQGIGYIFSCFIFYWIIFLIVFIFDKF